MAINPTGMIKSLGWGRFFQLLAHLPSFLKLFARLVKDPRVNIAPKLVILGVLAYVVLPTDLVPDFIPGLGYADDLAVLLAGLKLSASLPARGCSGTCKVDCRGKMISAASRSRNNASQPISTPISMIE